MFTAIGLSIKVPDVNFFGIRVGGYNTGMIRNLSDLVDLHLKQDLKFDPGTEPFKDRFHIDTSQIFYAKCSCDVRRRLGSIDEAFMLPIVRGNRGQLPLLDV